MLSENNTLNNSNDMNCSECPYKRMFDKMEKDTAWYQEKIDRLEEENRTLRVAGEL